MVARLRGRNDKSSERPLRRWLQTGTQRRQGAGQITAEKRGRTHDRLTRATAAGVVVASCACCCFLARCRLPGQLPSQRGSWPAASAFRADLETSGGLATGGTNGLYAHTHWLAMLSSPSVRSLDRPVAPSSFLVFSCGLLHSVSAPHGTMHDDACYSHHPPHIATLSLSSPCKRGWWLFLAERPAGLSWTSLVTPSPRSALRHLCDIRERLNVTERVPA